MITGMKKRTHTYRALKALLKEMLLEHKSVSDVAQKHFALLFTHLPTMRLLPLN